MLILFTKALQRTQKTQLSIQAGTAEKHIDLEAISWQQSIASMSPLMFLALINPQGLADASCRTGFVSKEKSAGVQLHEGID